MASDREVSNLTASSWVDEDGGGAVRGASSGVAGEECVTASATTASASEGGEYVTAGMSKLQIAAAIEKSREQGWSELKDGAQDGAAACSHGLDDQLVWEELKKQDPDIFRDFRDTAWKLGRVIAEGGQATIYEASYLGYNDRLVAKVFKMEGFSLADLQRQWPLATKAPSDGSDSTVMDSHFRGVFVGLQSHILGFVSAGREVCFRDAEILGRSANADQSQNE